MNLAVAGVARLRVVVNDVDGLGGAKWNLRECTDLPKLDPDAMLFPSQLVTAQSHESGCEQS